MNILIIEDDTHKLKQISEFITECDSGYEIALARSYQSGLKSAFSRRFDLVLLDMSLPTFDVKSGEDGYKFIKTAGIDILTEFRRKKNDAKVIIVTQFDSFGEGSDYIELKTLKQQLRERFGKNYVGAVYYEASQVRWKSELRKMIEKIANLHND